MKPVEHTMKMQMIRIPTKDIWTEMLRENMELAKVIEGVLPNLAKKTGLSTKVADATGMPKGKGLDAD